MHKYKFAFGTKMFSKYLVIFVLLFLVVLCSRFNLKKAGHQLYALNWNQLDEVASLSDARNMDYNLNNILLPRVVGTSNHSKVCNFIKEELRKYGFTVDVDEFRSFTPTHGNLTFKNIIGTLNPNAERYLVLACHYDSKYFKNEVFVGATDSAVPCSMMLNLAKTMHPQLAAIKENDLSLMLLFLDGEEAFFEWTDSDSLYGARHLAEEMHGRKQRTSTGENVTDLNRIDLFVLLDLLGPKNPQFYSYFRNTDRHHLSLSRIEDALDQAGLLEKRKGKYFLERTSSSSVQDDHIPFLRRGVPILHVIPSPFPKEWHTPEDNRNAIDMSTIENLNKILRVFTIQYLLGFDKNSDSDDEDTEAHTIHEEF